MRAVNVHSRGVLSWGYISAARARRAATGQRAAPAAAPAASARARARAAGSRVDVYVSVRVACRPRGQHRVSKQHGSGCTVHARVW